MGNVLNALCHAGVTLALDDFGVAYSSLSRLADLPVRWIKVDRSFLRDVPTNDAAAALLQSILGLIDALGLSSIVEGVETEEHLRHLLDLGVTAAQGYYLAPPMPASEMEPLLAGRPASVLGRP
jgi:EAL domain-containing protein (putative c-di-GMP-specific phosphodiesterase class I)